MGAGVLKCADCHYMYYQSSEPVQAITPPSDLEVILEAMKSHGNQEKVAELKARLGDAGTMDEFIEWVHHDLGRHDGTKWENR
jgi:hypothetical protein